MPKPIPLPSIEELRQTFNYDPDAGVLTWKVKVNRKIVIGSAAGHVGTNGYLKVGIKGKNYNVHRICWALYHGEDPGNLTIDHINRIPNDNRIVNLRLVDMCEQMLNQKLKSHNTSGHRGIYFDRQKKAWVARITVNRKVKYLGSYVELEDAVAARKKAEEESGVFIHQ